MEPIPQLIYKSNLDDFDTELKGYRNDAYVEAPNGDLFEVFFYDPTRLTKDIGDDIYLAHPGLIILNTVNKTSIEKAVISLWRKGFFDYFKPLSSIQKNHFEENI